MVFNYLIYDYLHFYILKEYIPIHTIHLNICDFFQQLFTYFMKEIIIFLLY